MEYFKEYDNCTLCPRSCNAERNSNLPGICGQTSSLHVSLAYLHMWEEPCISADTGSGTVFFDGCPLKCVFCQNHEISNSSASRHIGKCITSERLCDIFFELRQKGANNINLVTATHYIPHIKKAIKMAKEKGIDIPFVYNTSGYESVAALKELDGLIDIYLPDFKYMKPESSKAYSNASDYADVAKKALEEMYRQVGACSFDETSGLMKKGIIVRHLVLPGSVNEACSIIEYLYNTYKDSIYLSILNQYTPIEKNIPKDAEYNNLRRTLTKREYEKVVDFAISIGVTNAYTQDGKAISESFIPSFDSSGV